MTGRFARLIVMMIAGSVALGLPSWAQRFHSLGSADVTIDTDGLVLVSGVDPEAADDALEVLDAMGVRIGSTRNTVLVDSSGVDWTWERDRIVGRRLGAVVHKRSVPGLWNRPRAVEDASGTRWFVVSREIQSFNGTTWSRHDAPQLASNLSTPMVVSVPAGRQHVYFWRAGGSEAMVTGGPGVGYPLFDLKRDRSGSPIRGLMPLANGAVATLPGYEILGPFDRALHFPSTPSRFRRADFCPLGRFMVLGYSTFLDTHGGPLIVRASKVCDFGSSPPTRWRTANVRRGSRSDPRRVIPMGTSVLLRADDVNNVRLASEVEQAFDASYVDRSDRLWRFARGSLAFLEIDQAATLADSSSREPVHVTDFFGVDARGLAYFQLAGRKTFVFDRLGKPDLTANLAWLRAPVEVWTPARESEALQLAKSAIFDSQPERALEAASRMSAIAGQREDLLSHAELWPDLSMALWEAAGRRGGHKRQGLARAAKVVGLDEVVVREVLAESAALAVDGAQAEFGRVTDLASLAESAGELIVAFDAHRLAMQLAVKRGGPHSRQAQTASQLAARLRRFDSAIEWAQLGIDAGQGYEGSQLQEQVDALERYQAEQDSLEGNLLFLQRYWLRHVRNAHGVIDAIKYLTEHFELEGGPYRFIMETLFRRLIAVGRLDEAAHAVDELRDSGLHAYELALQLQLDLGQAYARLGRFHAALAALDLVRLRGAHTVFEHRARINAGQVHLDTGEPYEAYRMLRPLIPLTHQGVSYFHGLREDDCRSVALILAEAYEELERYEEALACARVARHRFGFRSWLHHYGSRHRQHDLRLKRLEALVVGSGKPGNPK